MSKKVKAIPEGYHSVTPYMIIKNAADAIEFYKKAFEAKEIFRMAADDGRVQHAEIKIGNSHIMLADEFPEMNCFAPQTSGLTPVMLHLYVEDVDTIFNKAVAAGAEVTRPLSNQFYGDRLGCLTDPYGHCWSVASHVEDVAPDEIARRAKEQKYS